MGGSVQAMMRAAGFTNEKDFFKAIEAGKILTKDVLPKFSQELRKMSRAGGALDKTMESTPAQFQRFMNALTDTKLAFYDNGMDKGLAYMFKSLADSLAALKPLAKSLGGVFRGVVGIFTGAFKLIIAPVEALTDVISTMWGALGADKFGIGGKMWAVIGAGGTLLLMVRNFKFLRDMIFSTNTTLLLLMRNLARLALLPMIFEDVYGFLKGKDSLLGLGADKAGSSVGFSESGQSSFQNQWLRSIQSVVPFGMLGTPEPTNVVITVKDGEFSKAITATVEKGNQAKTATTQSEVSQ